MTAMNAAPSPEETVDHALKSFLADAATDPDLRRRLPAGPRAALAAAVLSRRNATSIVLPVPTRPDGDLADGDLGAVSGGGPINAIVEALTLIPTVPFLADLKHGPSSPPVVAETLTENLAKQWHNKSTA